MEPAIVFLPLIGALVAGLFGPVIGERGAQVVTSVLLVAAAVMSGFVFADVALGGAERTVSLFSWIDSGDFEVEWALRVDSLTAVMLVVVTTVSAVVHLYSIGYMHGDPGVPRFMAYLSLFTFAMLMLVTADNLVQMFFGWEGVGLCSYLLIGFWYDRPSANAAAIKAFLVNRVGDFGFALGIMGVFLLFNSIDFTTIFAAAPGMQGQTIEFLGMRLDALDTLCILLFIGAMGKSAQVPLHTWLPDAMEGPTPVSALIHAATMVTAGVFMVCRLSPLFEHAPTAQVVVTLVGAITAIFAATVALTQNDIKRVIAYSTCSQLGYMFFAAGVSAYGAAMFHLFTHAFFKALLFLGAGSVIHAMSGEQDMRRMGALWRVIPITYVLMWIGNLALAGIGIPRVFGFAGFYSKDTILEAAWASHTPIGQFAFWIGVVAALLTAFYSWRLLLMTFHGKFRGDHHAMEHAHESPRIMLWPLYLLAAGAIFAGYFGAPYFVGEEREHFWREAIAVLPGHDTLEAAHHVPEWVAWSPLVVAVLGILLAYVFYSLRPDLPGRIAGAFGGVYRFLLNKWYFDELYDAVFVRPAQVLGYRFWRSGDVGIIDAFGPDGLAATTRDLARRTSRLQTGFVYHYAFSMLIGVVILVSWYMAWRLG